MKATQPILFRARVASVCSTALLIGLAIQTACGGTSEVEDGIAQTNDRPDNGAGEGGIVDSSASDVDGSVVPPVVEAGLDSGSTSVSPSQWAADKTVHAVIHAGDAWYFGGSFGRVSRTAAPSMLRLSTSGDRTGCDLADGFSGGTVHAIVQDGNDIYVGGSFGRIVKIDATTCLVDKAFTRPIGFDGTVNALALSGSSLYVAGAFETYEGKPGSALRIAKLDRFTGQLDTTFSPPGVANNGFNSEVRSLAVTSTAVYVGGAFSKYRDAVVSGARIVKLDLATGARDLAFLPPASLGTVFSMIPASGGLYLGGAAGVAKVDPASGQPDTAFAPGGLNPTNGAVYALALDGGSIFVGGAFTVYRGLSGSANALMKLDAVNGTLDTAFAGLNGASGFGSGASVNALAVLGGHVYAGGSFNTYRNVSNSVHGIAKLDAANGVQDIAFHQAGETAGGFGGRNETVNAILTNGSSMWVGGSFSFYGGYVANRIAKFDDKTLAFDTAFSPATSNGFTDDDASMDLGYVRALAFDGKSIFAGGSFSNYRGVAMAANNLAKLDPGTGVLDTTFGPVGAGMNGTNDEVRALVVANNSLYVGGSFTRYRSDAGNANRIAKVDLLTGQLDTAFSPPSANGFDASVAALAASDTALYVGGSMTKYRGASTFAKSIAKLDLATGALDSAFTLGALFDRDVSAIAVSGGSVYVGGNFTEFRGAKWVSRITKLDAATGVPDPTFHQAKGLQPTGTNGDVSSILVVGDAVYLGGRFDAFVDYQGVAWTADGIAKIDGAARKDSAFKTGFSGGGYPYVGSTGALAHHKGTVLAAGTFETKMSGPFPCNSVFVDSATGMLKF